MKYSNMRLKVGQGEAGNAGGKERFAINLIATSSVILPHWVPWPNGRARSSGCCGRRGRWEQITPMGGVDRMFQRAGATAKKTLLDPTARLSLIGPVVGPLCQHEWSDPDLAG